MKFPIWPKIKHEVSIFTQSRILAAPEGDQNKILTFIHLPKCAGNAVLPWILSHYRYRQIVLGYFNAGEISLMKAQKSGAKCYIGHFTMDINPRPSNFFFASVMRDPVSRIISHYHFVKQFPGHYLHRIVEDHRMSLLEYALSDIADSELDNGQTRLLAGLAEGAKIDDAAFEVARTRIERNYNLIGRIEDLSTFVAEFCKGMGWRQPLEIQVRNRSNYDRKLEISGDVEDAIRHRNRWDQLLYQEFAVRSVLNTQEPI